MWRRSDVQADIITFVAAGMTASGVQTVKPLLKADMVLGEVSNDPSIFVIHENATYELPDVFGTGGETQHQDGIAIWQFYIRVQNQRHVGSGQELIYEIGDDLVELNRTFQPISGCPFYLVSQDIFDFGGDDAQQESFVVEVQRWAHEASIGEV